ncbi:MAG: cysteine synthase A [Pseudomonadota bacterium]
MRGKFQNIIETVGDTPIVKINRLAPEGVEMWAKVEAFNPLGSVKDRLAMGIIEAAEASGELKPGQTVVEATSGNTGIGLAMVCAARGYPFVSIMVETFSVERRKLMRFLGAQVIVTPKEAKGTGMIDKARELVDKHGWFWARQFENPANADVHERTTAREIMAAFEGEKLDYFVTGTGTGGTLSGVGRVMRKERPETKIIVTEPDVAAIMMSGAAQERHSDGTPAASHPSWTPHPIQGWTPDFIPLVAQEAIDKGYIDRFIPVSGEESIAAAKALAQKEGIFCGVSCGATFAAAQKIAAEAESGARILCMLPDTGERYLSTPLFGDVEEHMTEAEWEIARSTPTAVLAG